MHTICTPLFTLSLTTLFTFTTSFLPSSSPWIQAPWQPTAVWSYFRAAGPWRSEPPQWLQSALEVDYWWLPGVVWNVVNISVAYKSRTWKRKGDSAKFWYNDIIIILF